MSDKPREFWIEKGLRRGDDFVADYNETRLFKGTHVIEYSAYQLLEQRLSEALVKIAELQNELKNNKGEK